MVQRAEQRGMDRARVAHMKTLVRPYIKSEYLPRHAPRLGNILRGSLESPVASSLSERWKWLPLTAVRRDTGAHVGGIEFAENVAPSVEI